MKRLVSVFFTVVMLWLAVPALAVPVWRTNPPGQPPTTYQEWTFDDSDNPAVPEVVNNLYGTPLATIIVEGDVHHVPAGWYGSYLGRSGVWHGMFTSIELWIPNRREPLPYKEIWVEVGFRGELLPHVNYPQYGDDFAPKLTAWSGGNELGQDHVSELGRIIENIGSGWRKLTIGWRILPNPDEEKVYLAFHDSGADIDYVIVDTICDIPEPATIALLGLGALSLLRRKPEADKC